MSRIHEALKKAAQERAVLRPSDVAEPGIDSAITPALNRGNGSASAAADVLTQTDVLPPPRNDYLRFDELRAHCAHPHWHPSQDLNVFASPVPSPQGAEQFRTLRSRLYQLRSSQSLRTILITSSVAAEGKTFVASNLAQAIVRQPDRRVLLIDADLRCPRLHTVLGAPSSPGLTDYLRGTADELAIIQNGQEGNLCFIPGGSEVANPSELLSNDKLKILLDRVAPVFDWVILDSPPCLPVADASVLASLCDGLLLVVRAESTPAGTAQRACQELQGRNILGVVLNAVEKAPAYGSSYYYDTPDRKSEE
jgi:protein-tyrosine kinase